MNVQYISDSQGTTTDVFIPIYEWTEIKKMIPSPIEEHPVIPQSQIQLVEERMEAYRKNPALGINFDKAMKDIENELLCV